MNAPDTYHLHSALGYQMSRTARLQERGFETMLKSIDLTRTSWCILLAVVCEKLRNPSAIAEFIGIDRTATSRALKSMASQGIIERNHEKDDARRTTVKATTIGLSKLAQANIYAKENAARFETKLNETEREALSILLEKLQSGENKPLNHL